MGARSGIEWTESTWTPIRARHFEIQDDGSGKERVGWHCEHVSEGCRNCYAESINLRLGTGLDFKPGALFREERKGYHNGDAHVFLDEKMLLAPLRWKRPRMIFVCSMTDAFADFVNDEWLDKMFAVMALAPHHTFQVLTKRSRRMRDYCTLLENGPVRDTVRRIVAAWPLPNVWLGVSCEDQRRADERVPDLLATPAAVRFVSAEPLLGGIDFEAIRDPSHFPGCLRKDVLRGREHHEDDGDQWTVGKRLDWIIGGYESGTHARPRSGDLVRDIRDQCAATGVPFFFKQHGEWIDVRDLRSLPGGSGPGFGVYDHCKHDIETDTVRVGKHRAGRVLDGNMHNEYPRVSAREAALTDASR